jgi:hypothetical protein
VPRAPNRKKLLVVSGFGILNSLDYTTEMYAISGTWSTLDLVAAPWGHKPLSDLLEEAGEQVTVEWEDTNHSGTSGNGQSACHAELRQGDSHPAGYFVGVGGVDRD